MTERRPFPPSSRRLALARQAGLTAASPLVVGALACIAAVVASVMLARAAASTVGGWIAAACRAAATDTSTDVASTELASSSSIASSITSSSITSPSSGGGVTSADGLLVPSSVTRAILELAAPLLAGVAIVALIAHVAQTRALWLPRRRVAGAPSVAPTRVRDAAVELTAAAVIGAVAFGWLWTTAPHLAGLFAIEPTFERMLVAVGSAVASSIIALAIAWLALATLDALVRRADLAHALAMTITEKREDDRLAAADPRWRAQRLALTRGPSPSTAVARAALMLLGDDMAIAIAWDARRQPVPLRTITGRGSRATQLLALARRHRIPVHRDAALAAALVGGEGVIPDNCWGRLAEILVAVQGANMVGRDLST